MNRQRMGHKPVSEFIKFIPMGWSPSGKTQIWHVVNLMRPESPDQVGVVSWSGAWRKYVYHSPEASFYDHDCLRLIADFIETQTLEHRARKATLHRVNDLAKTDSTPPQSVSNPPKETP